MTIKTKPFNIAEYLENTEDIREFLRESLETGDTSDFIHALNTATKAKGLTAIAEAAGLSRQVLRRALAPGAQPKFKTIRKVVEALGCKLTVA